MTTALSATCRVCFRSYDPASNGPFSCCYHPGSLRGESPRKSDWQDEDYDRDGRHKSRGSGGESGDDECATTSATTTSIDNSQLVYTYTCCGAPEGAEGCTRDRCKSFDDPWDLVRWVSLRRCRGDRMPSGRERFPPATTVPTDSGAKDFRPRPRCPPTPVLPL